MSAYRKRCHCTATLLPDGTCPHPHCKPRDRAPAKRAVTVRARLRAREATARKVSRLGLPAAEPRKWTREGDQ